MANKISTESLCAFKVSLRCLICLAVYLVSLSETILGGNFFLPFTRLFLEFCGLSFYVRTPFLCWGVVKGVFSAFYVRKFPYIASGGENKSSQKEIDKITACFNEGELKSSLSFWALRMF